MQSFTDGVEELQKLLGLANQNWLLGAGASAASNIPLMHPLTARVNACLKQDEKQIVNAIMGELVDDCHIEHVLSHLGDLIAIAERTKLKCARVAGEDRSVDSLTNLYRAVVEAISTTVRYGYRAKTEHDAERIGSLNDPIVEIDHHLTFVRELFRSRANLEGRSRINFATTNYDTLLEDALGLSHRIAVDGFEGGAVGFWSGASLDPTRIADRCHLVLKLHGSVDWFQDPQAALVKARYGVKYLSDLSATLIYPRATKYVETQKDPFARLFQCFRQLLMLKDSHILGVVGYSFGDDHINSEIELALRERHNKTILVAFSKEGPAGLCSALERWRMEDGVDTKICIASDKALYFGKRRLAPSTQAPLAWWTFQGLSRFVADGSVT